MNQLNKKTWKKIIFISFTLINIIFSLLSRYIQKPFLLSENQLLYIFASIAQVTGGLFGLTLAAYTIIDDKLKKIGDTEETSLDYTNHIRLDNFYNLILISLLSISTIVLSLVVLSLYRNQYMEITILFVLETVCLFCYLLIEIYTFIKNANPSNIAIRKEAEKELFDSEYSTSSNDDAKSFGSFITYYNMLENSIKEFAQALLDNGKNNTPLQMLDSLDIIKDHRIISQKCYAQINELRLYRNSLVHSIDADKNVSPNLYEILEKIYKLFLSITDSYGNDALYENAISSLNAYIDTLPVNIDENLLHFLINHQKVTIRDIIGSCNISFTIAHRKLQKLITYGYITKVGNDKNSCFQLSDSFLNGSFSFDYSNNNGEYRIGINELTFSTKWSKGSNDIIHAYSDCKDIDSIARIKQSKIANITMSDLSNCDYSSRCRDIAIGDIAVWKNKNGHYLLTLITAIQDDTRGYDSDLVQGTYRILI